MFNVIMLSVTIKPFMLNVIMPSVVKLGAVAPYKLHLNMFYSWTSEARSLSAIMLKVLKA